MSAFTSVDVVGDGADRVTKSSRESGNRVVGCGVVGSGVYQIDQIGGL